MSKEHATQSHPSKLEKDVMELNACNEYLRQKLKKLDARIQYLIRLGLETTRPEHMEQWQEEEEL
jgi:hypothetical protein